MRRAIKPAIWRTRIRWPLASRPTDVCSFSRLDSSAAALRNLAGFLWTLYTAAALQNKNTLAVRFEAHRCLLVLEARFLGGGVEKLARVLVDVFHGTGH